MRLVRASVLGLRLSAGRSQHGPRPARTLACASTDRLRMHSQTITPTASEQTLFDLLVDSARRVEQDAALQQQVGLELGGAHITPRAAGGWVRDKLLGLESHDIDIALNAVTGAKFGEAVQALLSARGEETFHLTVVKANPGQSKHLETACIALHGYQVDLVNLRSETYTDTRIPEMEFGTPEQDAERRDFTVNSLFYNLATRGVEDHTGRGLADLAAGTLRTPLPAAETFRDDPLRALRGIRFATRFGFELHPDAQAAAASQEVGLLPLLCSHFRGSSRVAAGGGRVAAGVGG